MARPHIFYRKVYLEVVNFSTGIWPTFKIVSTRDGAEKQVEMDAETVLCRAVNNERDGSQAHKGRSEEVQEGG